MSAIYPAHLSRRLLASACFHGPLTVASAAANGQFARDSSGCGFCAVLIMLTMPDSNEPSQPKKASRPESREPFQLADGNTYVEHAGMAVEAERIRSFKTAF